MIRSCAACQRVARFARGADRRVILSRCSSGECGAAWPATSGVRVPQYGPAWVAHVMAGGRVFSGNVLGRSL